MINASDSLIGTSYKSSSGIIVEVIEKQESIIIVKSTKTGKLIPLPPNYNLESVEVTLKTKSESVQEKVVEEKMPNEVTVVTAPKKLKKSNIVDQGLAASLSADEIVKNVLAAFPETLEKAVRNLVSVRRSKLEKPTA